MSSAINKTFGSHRLLWAFALMLSTFSLSCAMPWQPASNAAPGGGGGVAAGDTLPRKAPPQGMSELPTGGGGRVLTSRMSGTPSARKMLTALFMGIDGYFDARPTLTTAYADAADQNLQAAFIAKLAGVPVRGVMAIQMRGATGQATLVFDRSELFPQTFPRLLEAVSQPAPGVGGGAPQQVQLTPTALPDGSGRIGLPPGWRIVNSYKGTVDLQGPNGEIMGLGLPVFVNSKLMGGMYPNVPKVDFGDPVRAALDYAAFQHQQVQVIDAKPIQLPIAGRYAFMRFKSVINGLPVDGLGLYGIAPVDQTQGMLYISYAVAPSEVFPKSLPAMWAAWQSWGVSNAVLNERLNSAVNSMRETGDIITGSYWDRQDTYAKVNRAWSDVMRDESVWRDPADPNTHYRIKGNPSPADMGGLEPVPIQDLIP